jgi:hypothetical protein
MNKKDLKGKHILFIDKQGKQRVQRVIKVVGSYVTVRHTKRIKPNGKVWKFPKHRIHKDRIIGVQHRRKGVEEIVW